MTRREELAQVREHNAAWAAVTPAGPELSSAERGRLLFQAGYDRRFLLGLVDELAVALRYQWLRTNEPHDVHILLDELGLWAGPDA